MVGARRLSLWLGQASASMAVPTMFQPLWASKERSSCLVKHWANKSFLGRGTVCYSRAKTVVDVALDRAEQTLTHLHWPFASRRQLSRVSSIHVSVGTHLGNMG